MTRLSPSDLMLAYDFMRAYGCREYHAVELLEHRTEFAIAARSFGPLLCHFDRHAKRWRLCREPMTREQIVAAYDARQARVA